MPGHVLHEAEYYVVTVSAARCNAQYSFKTTCLNTFGSHLVCMFVVHFFALMPLPHLHHFLIYDLSPLSGCILLC